MKQINVSILSLLLSLFAAAQQKPAFTIQPYLQHATQTSIRIHWETNVAAATTVEYSVARLDARQPLFDLSAHVPGTRTMHHVQLNNLKPQTKYFYRTISLLPGGDSIISEVNTFETAVTDSSAFAFAVFSDSQNDARDPEAWKRVSTQAYKERPNFAVHAGDLVDLGYMKDDWVNEFFAQGNLFMKTLPIFSIAGNHEHDAAYYYQYMYTPTPYFYSFKYGNAEFFMIDTDQYQEEGSDLYNKVELALARSTAYWKFVVHHHPPFSSDDDDFGNTYAEASTLGDNEVAQLIPLYEKYGVDIVFYGHIHTYERTWPILKNKIAGNKGVHYINLGGAGGSLEKPAPTRSWFSNKLRTVHHFGYVRIYQNQLYFEAIDENGFAFDAFSISESRRKTTRNLTPAAPVVTTDRRIFTDSLLIQLTTANPGDDIRYTLDGSIPGKTSSKYKGAITLTQTATVRSIAYNQHGKGRATRFHFTKETMKEAVLPHKAVAGLHYGYFTGKLADGDTAAFSKTTILKTGFTRAPIPAEIPHERQYWGVLLNGYIEVPADGYYTFEGHADHRLRLTVHDKVLFDEEDREINYKGEIFLQKGHHPVKIDYYNSREGRYFLELYYTGPGIERQPIPVSAWRHSDK